jgi:hypothetical protein
LALQEFLAVLGGYFQAVQATMQSFLLHQVAPFQGISSKQLARLCSHMLVSTFKAGKTWQLAAEEQVYFVKVGQPGAQQCPWPLTLICLLSTAHAWCMLGNSHFTRHDDYV